MNGPVVATGGKEVVNLKKRLDFPEVMVLRIISIVH